MRLHQAEPRSRQSSVISRQFVVAALLRRVFRYRPRLIETCSVREDLNPVSASRRLAALSVLLLVGPAAAHAGELGGRPVVALFPAGNAERTEALVSGARLAFERAREEGGPDLELIVVERGESWGNAASEAARLLARAEPLALITPPEREVAHLLAQVGTRAHVPVISTSSAPSVTATGSSWIRTVVAAGPAGPGSDSPMAPSPDPDCSVSANPGAKVFVNAYRRRYGSGPSAVAAAGYDAARVVIEAVLRGGPGRAGVLAGLAEGRPVRGATGLIVFDRSGRRVADR